LYKGELLCTKDVQREILLSLCPALCRTSMPIETDEPVTKMEVLNNEKGNRILPFRNRTEQE
jgi:hypothetical protein